MRRPLLATALLLACLACDGSTLTSPTTPGDEAAALSPYIDCVEHNLNAMGGEAFVVSWSIEYRNTCNHRIVVVTSATLFRNGARFLDSMDQKSFLVGNGYGGPHFRWHCPTRGCGRPARYRIRFAWRSCMPIDERRCLPPPPPTTFAD